MRLLLYILMFCLNHLQRNSITMFLGWFFKLFEIINHTALLGQILQKLQHWWQIAKEALLTEGIVLSS